MPRHLKRLGKFISALWSGRVPLGRVFWAHAVGYGTILNLITTFAAFIAFARDWPGAVGLALFFLPAPYNLLMVIAVWRSAARYSGPPVRARLARILIVVWAIVATFI